MSKRKLISISVGSAVIVVFVMFIIRIVGRCYYKAIFEQAPGLRIGNKITVLGIPVGAVSDIKIYEDSIIAIFWVKNIRLKQGASLSLEPINIFGNKELVLEPGEGDILPPHSTIYGSSKKGLRETIVSLGVFVDHLDSLIYEMIFLTSDAQRAFNETAKGLEKTIMSVEEEAVRTLKGLREITSSTDKMLDKSTADLTATIGNLRDVSAHLKSLLEAADTNLTTGLYALANTTARIDTLTSFILTSRGTVGKLFTDQVLYAKIESTISLLKGLIEDIKENPTRYFKIF